MADLNIRQINFITRLKSFGLTIENLYGEAHALSETYAEEFANGQDNDLSSADNLEDAYSFDAADIATAVNQAIVNFLNYWVGDAVNAREYGKDIRRIK